MQVNDMQIRRADEKDYPVICSLINNELGYPDVNVEDLTSRIELMNQDDNYRAFVALIDDKVVGFIGTVQGIAFEVKGFYLRIVALAVLEEQQGKGIGSSLLKYVEDYADSKGINTFAVSSGLQRLNTHLFYEKNGFLKSSYSFWKGKHK